MVACGVPAGRLLDVEEKLPLLATCQTNKAMLVVQGGGVGPHVDNYDVFLLQGLTVADMTYFGCP